ncbi:MAG: phosphofructokinase, partial [Desulfobacterales bacterium]
MSSKKRIEIGELLKHPKVRKVTDNVNAALQERRRYSPPVCKALSKKYSRLQPTDDFHFTVDKEAQKQLPDIIHNTVQKIQGLSTADAAVEKTYQQKRNIGIVFSGGPAPGGHNVIAGLYDAAQKANPKSRVYGFLIGPDGIIENEALELNDDLVDAYRNLGGFTMIKTGRT